MITRWVCPHCEHAVIVSSENSRIGSIGCAIDSADGNWATSVRYVVCPNPSCRLTTIQVFFGNGTVSHGPYATWYAGTKPKEVRLRPSTYARPMPEYIPRSIREDYEEACAIIDLSPKAAATLARRALQGMIRDFHGVSKANLAKEIEAIRDRVDPLTWKAIDAVRGMGNIGAHMERDIDLIIDVDPSEAERLVRLIEMLIREWYIARHGREQELAEIIGINEEKQALRRGIGEVAAPDRSDESEPPPA